MKTAEIGSKSYISKRNEKKDQIAANFSNECKMNISMENCLDKKYIEAVTSPSIVVIETNLPSSQALKSFSLKLMQIKARLHGEVR